MTESCCSARRSCTTPASARRPAPATSTSRTRPAMPGERSSHSAGPNTACASASMPASSTTRSEHGWWLPNEVELLRRSDLVEVAPELVRWGIPRAWLKRELWLAVPRAGYWPRCIRNSADALAADASRDVPAADAGPVGQLSRRASDAARGPIAPARSADGVATAQWSETRPTPAWWPLGAGVANPLGV